MNGDSTTENPGYAAHIALIGNPNTGKSTLFNHLSGLRQRVGNYPGVTVEKKTGEYQLNGKRCQLIDLPGTYSLAARSPDELVVLEVLSGKHADVGSIDVILCVVDAGNLQRNLYLFSQLADLGLPIVVALNMMDVARGAGTRIDIDQLSNALGVPVVATEAHRKLGLALLQDATDSCLQNRQAPQPLQFSGPVQAGRGADCPGN